MATPCEQQDVGPSDLDLSYHGEKPTSISQLCYRATSQSLDSHTTSSKSLKEPTCPDDCPSLQYSITKPETEPNFPEPEGDDGSIETVATKLYKHINSLWQTRILRLLPGPIGSALSGDLLVADLVLLPGLVLHDDQQLISYQALSYCCGEPILTRRIEVNGEQLPISENLFLALQKLRQSEEPIFLWVDAMCIHQNDELEKSEQVVNMLDIYHKASQVDVWLGAAGQNTGLAMKILALDDGHEMPNSEVDSIADGSRDLFSRPWFRRIWVKQEIYAARRLRVHCGFHSASEDFVIRWKSSLKQIFLTAKSALSNDLLHALENYYQCLGSFRQATEGALVKRNHAESPNPLLHDGLDPNGRDYNQDVINILRRCAGSKCTKPQDYLYALLGMTDLKYHASNASSADDYALILDYGKSLSEIFIELAHHIIRRDRRLAVLVLETSYGPTDSMPDLPSWVPDLRFTRLTWSLNQQLTAIKYKKNSILSPSLNRCGKFPVVESDSKDSLLGPKSGLRRSTRTLAISGRRVGLITLDHLPDSTCATFRLSSEKFINVGWNIFHERHVHRCGLPEELSNRVTQKIETEAHGTDLQSLSDAVLKAIRGLRLRAPKLFQIDITRNSVTLGTVLVSGEFDISDQQSWVVMFPGLFGIRTLQLYTSLLDSGEQSGE